MALDPIVRLEIVDAVARVKARYFRCIDRKDWDHFPELFTEDVEVDVTDDMKTMGLEPARGITVGRERFARNVARALDGVRTVHQGHMPEIEVLAPDHARAIWATSSRVMTRRSCMTCLRRWRGVSSTPRSPRLRRSWTRLWDTSHHLEKVSPTGYVCEPPRARSDYDAAQ